MGTMPLITALIQHEHYLVTDKPKATLRADTTTIPAGGSVSLTWSVDGSDDWKYYGFRRDSHSAADPVRDVRGVMVVTEGGFYRCRGGRGDPEFFTQNSEEVFIQKTGSEATATLTADRTVLAAGGRVTLTCSVDRSYSWKYVWFRRTSVSSEAQTVGDTDQPNTVITQGGVYTCRGRRGQPEFFTQESSKVTIKETGEFSHLFWNKTTFIL
ncbi:uncharacterized protein LOC130164144 [Seriola aureovittata]|uniref:uncharacterized protein LOC130164144 n=1 Tax=Seriola aureovittata TaxID=2871759 RepID=UPI0024BE7CAF|nr:uncharacterized protein LOC130164144 [Seriola aureovittata]